MKPGDRVKCVDTSGTSALTAGAEYTIDSIHDIYGGRHFMLRSSDGTLIADSMGNKWLSHRFEAVP